MKLFLSDLDVYYDIVLAWQIPVPFFVAICFAITVLFQSSESETKELDYAKLVGGTSFIWLVSAVALFVIDLFILTPVFVIMQLGSALVLA